ncbi:uncharacterized protein LOC129700860 isoform X2 [Leucoraja erinacea]|uniref:uncharacterized protein LOC129700860 isoform X2 n=1 Tax=Leucoraja erinaceus TaxID=7782 RepID=UPI002453850A|nr:uncharacterized protein LOC129700860 isoform X2 [Leucoraja erinacea]
MAFLEFCLPLQLIIKTLECINLTSIGKIPICDLFLLSPVELVNVCCLLLSLMTVDKDTIQGGHYEYNELYCCLYFLLQEIIQRGCPQDIFMGLLTTWNFRYKWFYDFLATEIVLLFALVPVFYDQVGKNTRVNNILTLATGDIDFATDIAEMIQGRNCQKEDKESLRAAASELVIQRVYQCKRRINRNYKSKQQFSFPLKTNKLLPCKSISELILASDRLHQGIRRSPRKRLSLTHSAKSKEPCRMPALGDYLLTASQIMGQIVRLPNPLVAEIQADVFLADNNSFLTDGELNTCRYYAYVDLHQLEWDEVLGYWKLPTSLAKGCTAWMTGEEKTLIAMGEGIEEALVKLQVQKKPGRQSMIAKRRIKVAKVEKGHTESKAECINVEHEDEITKSEISLVQLQSEEKQKILLDITSLLTIGQQKVSPESNNDCNPEVIPSETAASMEYAILSEMQDEQISPEKQPENLPPCQTSCFEALESEIPEISGKTRALLKYANRSSKKLPQPDKSRREIEVTIPIISLDHCLSELHNTDLMCSLPSKSDPICASRKHPHHRKGKKIFSPIQPQSNENQLESTSCKRTQQGKHESKPKRERKMKRKPQIITRIMSAAESGTGQTELEAQLTNYFAEQTDKLTKTTTWKPIRIHGKGIMSTSPGLDVIGFKKSSPFQLQSEEKDKFLFDAESLLKIKNHRPSSARLSDCKFEVMSATIADSVEISGKLEKCQERYIKNDTAENWYKEYSDSPPQDECMRPDSATSYQEKCMEAWKCFSREKRLSVEDLW